MRRFFLFVILFIAALAPISVRAQVDRIELGYQTTRRGVVWYRSGLPTHAPSWQFSRDTNAVLWVDTLTAIRYDWDYSDDRWRAKGTFSGDLPPLPQQASGSALIDNRTAFWIRDTFNLLHKYDSTANAWTPWGDWMYLSSVPTGINLSGSNGAAKYTRSLWQNSGTNEVRYWDGDSWEAFGGTADGSETIVTGTNGITVTGTGTSGTPYVVGMPSATTSQTLRHNGTAWLASSMLTNDGAGIGINSAPNASYRGFIKQSTTTDGLAIQRSSSTGTIELYHDAAGTLRTTVNNLDVRSAGQLSLYGAGGSLITQIFLSAQSNITANFGNSGLLRFSGTYAPTASGGDFSFMKFLPTINQTGAANQDVFMMDFNPTLTSVLGRLHGIRYWPSSGRFLWQPNGAGAVVNHLAGNLGIGSGSTSPAQTLHVEGTARITGSSGTSTSVMGRNANGDISNLSLSGMSITGGTLTATDGSTTNEIQTLSAGGAGPTSYTIDLSLSGGSVTLSEGTNVDLSRSGNTITIASTASGSDGDGIYSHSDTLPAGGTIVTIPSPSAPLQFNTNTQSGQSWNAITVNTASCADDRVTKYLVGKSPLDSVEMYSFDCGFIIKETGGQITIQGDKEMILLADSIQVTTLPAKTTLPYLTGLTNQDYLAKIQGTSSGQVLKWNTGGYWELGTAGGSGTVTGTGTANRLAYWTSSTNIAADDDAYFDGTDVGFGSTTMSAKVNINDGTAFVPYPLNVYGTASSAGGVVYAQVSNLLNTSTVVLSLNQDTTVNTIRAGIRKYGTSHASRANELEVFTSVASAPVTLSTNSTVRLTVAADGTVHATNKLAGGFSSTTGIHSTVQSGGSMAAAYLETVGSPTFDDTKHTVVYTGSTNVTWTLPTASTCTGRWYLLHHSNTAGTITLSQSITKGNGGNFNTITAGQWAWIVSTGSGWRGYKITSL